ncbi:hypothetical protein GWI33_016584 [Rhynchophorus ferrugineus]|uniref:Uncharacterized protein n=1 Tax=Rhynchophorus ferrugineus TaxID=354439 RepID=A0A834MA45_RHYFE|nr:hypothetical protein GWI33_016584 [Rhynchophorus ferrugineus]
MYFMVMLLESLPNDRFLRHSHRPQDERQRKRSASSGNGVLAAAQDTVVVLAAIVGRLPVPPRFGYDRPPSRNEPSRTSTQRSQRRASPASVAERYGPPGAPVDRAPRRSCFASNKRPPTLSTKTP